MAFDVLSDNSRDDEVDLLALVNQGNRLLDAEDANYELLNRVQNQIRDKATLLDALNRRNVSDVLAGLDQKLNPPQIPEKQAGYDPAVD